MCPKHGGNHPGQKKAAKERLLELVDPALAALHRILTDDSVDDTHKVRAAQLVLDRTGFKPGMTLEVGVSNFDALVVEALGGVQPTLESLALDRGLHKSSEGEGDPHWEDAHQHGLDAQTEAWREYDAEDEKPYATRLDPFDGNTVRGEVLSDSLLPDPTKDPVGPSEMGTTPRRDGRRHDDPPRYWGDVT